MSDRRHVREAIVLAAWSITPGMRRLVLGGPDLSNFTVPPGALGPYVKLHLRGGPGGRELVRTYSVRRHDPERGEITVDMLLHGDGVGARFAAEARPGDTARIGGPGHIPAEPCGTLLLAGDHTALPAIAQIVETAPAATAIRAFVEVPDRGEEQAMAGAPGAEIAWLHRPAGAPSRLVEAVRDGWPPSDGPLVVFAGAEAAIARAIRAHARQGRGITPARCQVLNYWKTGQPEGGFSYVA